MHSGRRNSDRTKRFGTRLLGQLLAIWTFVVIEGVEPTNNLAEVDSLADLVCLAEKVKLILSLIHG